MLDGLALATGPTLQLMGPTNWRMVIEVTSNWWLAIEVMSS